MIIVLGSVTTTADQLAQALAVSQAHVRRARSVPGCIAHAVHIDSEDPLRLVFVEQWTDQAAIWAHVQSAETRAFVQALLACATASSRTSFYQAEEIRRPAPASPG